MQLIIWIIIVGGLAFMVWYGFNLLVRRPGTTVDSGDPMAHCHICKQELPLDRLVPRERSAGIVHYYCGDCIEALVKDYRAIAQRDHSEHFSLN